MRTPILAAAALVMAAGGCGPSIRPLQPVMPNGAVLRPQSDDVVARARADGEVRRERLAEERERTAAAALAACSGRACEALARGEVAPGMSEAQVLAATRTTGAAWETRGSGRAAVMSRSGEGRGPSDAVGEIAWVALRDGAVRSITYREPQGFRTVSEPADATRRGVAAARAEALLRQGDDHAAGGELALALDRYDRADVLRPDDPETTLRIARTLDKALRPYEAQLRYRMFLHQMELERIRVTGEAYARWAAAIAEARDRVVVLDRR